MIEIRIANERGLSENDWLKSFHTFSFDQYYDENFMHFGSLRVINEDTVQAGKGFGTHPHRDMEIITYVVEGELEHRDSMGTGSIIKPGEIQRMSAGTGITHSEFNHSVSEPLHLLQIWITPAQKGLPPSYEQKTIAPLKNKLTLIGSPNDQEGAVKIHQDVNLYVAYLEGPCSLPYLIEPERQVWLQLIKGSLSVNGQVLLAGDGAAILEEKDLQMSCSEKAEFLLFDLANWM